MDTTPTNVLNGYVVITADGRAIPFSTFINAIVDAITTHTHKGVAPGSNSTAVPNAGVSSLMKGS